MKIATHVTNNAPFCIFLTGFESIEGTNLEVSCILSIIIMIVFTVLLCISYTSHLRTNLRVLYFFLNQFVSLFQPRGFKNYFSRLSMRVKNNSSYIRARLGSDRRGKAGGSKSFHGFSKTPTTHNTNTSITNTQSGFICYLNEFDEGNYVQLESSENDANEIIEEINRGKTQEATQPNGTSNTDEAVYVDVSSIRSLKYERSSAKCLICQSNNCR